MREVSEVQSKRNWDCNDSETLLFLSRRFRYRLLHHTVHERELTDLEACAGGCAPIPRSA